jgi:hypothetical protein
MNLSEMDLTDLNQFVDRPTDHIDAFISTFKQAVLENGPDSFIPMLTIFKSKSEIAISIQCRPFIDKDDMYKAYAEMLQYYSASNAYSFIIANDVRISTYQQDDPHSKKQDATDALSLSFVSSDSSGLLTLPYRIVDNQVLWSQKDFTLTSLTEDDPTKTFQGEMVELFYTMSHLDGPLFTIPQLLNYLSYKNFCLKMEIFLSNFD